MLLEEPSFHPKIETKVFPGFSPRDFPYLSGIKIEQFQIPYPIHVAEKKEVSSRFLYFFKYKNVSGIPKS